VHDYSSIERSVILPRARIGERFLIHNAIIHSRSVVPDGTRIGVDPDADAERYYVTEGGVTLVTPTMLRALTRSG
jgi:glucose-1-phosphate adenylyltransferase